MDSDQERRYPELDDEDMDPNAGQTSEDSFIGPEDLAVRKASNPTRRSKQKQPDIPDVFKLSSEAQEFIDSGAHAAAFRDFGTSSSRKSLPRRL